MTFVRRRWPAILGTVVLLILAALAWAWETPSGYYVFWPDKAHPAADYLHIPGGRPPAAGSGFYFVDVHEVYANKLEEFWGRYLQDGAELVPAEELLNPGESESQRVKQDFRAMSDSQHVAAAVAEKALGKPVKIDALGALVEYVDPHDPAAEAGVKAGDVITAVDGTPVRSARDLVRATAGLKPGDAATYTFRDAGPERIRTIAGGQGGKKAIIGVVVESDVRIARIPVPVRYSIHGIGGPSAGLAFALEIYDSLSGRHLLRGHNIAATGELDPLGDVGAIGGVKQKALGAIEAGVDTFLVPVDNVADARAAAGRKLRVIGVRTFSSALRDIRALPPA
ncbi:MAG TPA: PDZ domain-containing protein [Gaiellales bacterium]|jgi:PDZ domain-containing protein|nr:PDZ domain-containing protein [Gaiellales bacterium]